MLPALSAAPSAAQTTSTETKLLMRIANGLFREFPALTPWRYDVAEYERLAADPAGGFILQGSPVDAVWDPFLRPLMEREWWG